MECSTEPGIVKAIFLISCVILLILLYFCAPLPRIADTALLMDAWGWDGETWRRRIIRQYWMPPAIFTGALVVMVILFHDLKIPLEAQVWKIWKVAYYIWCAMIFLWPLSFCIRADRAYYRLETWRRMQVEHRIAAGLASSADYYHYIQDAKEDAYNEGYSDGEMFKW